MLNEQAKLEFYGYPLDYLDKYRAAVEKVTTADLDRVAKKYIDPSKLAILVVGNSSEFGTPLSTLGPVQPHRHHHSHAAGHGRTRKARATDRINKLEQ